jgi:uncharacterized protein
MAFGPYSYGMFDLVVGITGLIAGAIASVAGFGIGSVLTPVLALRLETRLAVAAVSVPHFLGTLLRFVRLRAHVDRRVLVRFGIASAAGGLAGALANARLPLTVLAAVFGGLLIFAGISELTGFMARRRFGRTTAAVAGVLSGFFGGLVGNQGGIRSAALLRFNVSRHAFVATATAVGLIVDGFRMPVYLINYGSTLATHARLIVIASIGVLVGTVVGERLLRKVPELRFRRVVAVLLILLGAFTIAHSL